MFFMGSDRVSWGEVDWKLYQLIVAGLHSTGSDDRTVEHEHEIPINTGGTKEIDVFVEDNPGRHKRQICIECKFHDRSVGQGVVDEVRGYLIDSTADKGVIVSKSGFQSGAIERAENINIDLWTLGDFDPDRDLDEDVVRYVNLDLNIIVPEYRITDIDLSVLHEENEGEEISVRTKTPDSQIYSKDMSPLRESLYDRAEAASEEPQEGEYSLEFDDGEMLILNGVACVLESVDYEITFSEHSNEYKIDGFQDVDGLFRNELTGEEEYVSLQEALESFTEDDHDRSESSA